MQRRRCSPAYTTRSFNPHPARRPDATREGWSIPAMPEVSILIQPEGRMQPVGVVALPFIHLMFQSSSSQKAGCNSGRGPAERGADVSILIQPEGRMQPLSSGLAIPLAEVSILIQPEGRMQHLPPLGCPTLVGVSILIQPEGRMQQSRVTVGLVPLSFNPHPARRPDATGRTARPATHLLFQSSSSQKAGCNGATDTHNVDVDVVSILIQPEGRMQLDALDDFVPSILVSILIQPEGRMQPPETGHARPACRWFQSSSSQKAGCNLSR